MPVDDRDRLGHVGVVGEVVDAADVLPRHLVLLEDRAEREAERRQRERRGRDGAGAVGRDAS